MQIGWNKEQLELREEYAQFGRTQVAPEVRANVAVHQFDQAAWKDLASTDFWKIAVPQSYGGLGGSWWDFTAAMEGLSTTCADLGFMMAVVPQAWMLYGLLAHGSEHVRRRFLPRLLEGEIAATAIAEPHSGTDVVNCRTQAIRVGDRFKLHGAKQNISHAGGKGFTMVVGRIPALGDRDITLFLVDKSASGYLADPTPGKSALHTLPTYDIRFRELSIGEEDILGGKGEGLRALADIMSIGRAWMGIMAAQLLQPVFEQALTFIRERQSQGKALRDHQYVQRRITEVQIRMTEARFVSYGALWALLNRTPEGPMLGSIAKLSGNQVLLEGARELLGLLGSRGFLESPAAHLAKDALGFTVVGGTEELHRQVVFRHAEKLNRRF